MCNSVLPIDISLHDSILIHSDGRQHIQCVFVARIDSIENQGDDDFLPRGSSLIPEFGFLQINDIPDVLHHSVERPRRQHLIFVVIGNRNQQFGMAVIHGRAQVVAIAQGKFVRIAGGRGIWHWLLPLFQLTMGFALTAHVREFFREAFLRFSILGLDRVLNGTGSRVIHAQHRSLHQFDLPSSITP